MRPNKIIRWRPLGVAALVVLAVFAVAFSARDLVAKIGLPEQKPLLDAVLSFMTWLAAGAGGLAAWAFTYAEMEAEEALARLRRILDTSLHGFNVFQAERGSDGQIRDFRLTFANKAAGEHFGKYSDQFLGKTLKESAGSALDPELYEEFCAVVESGEPALLEMMHQEDDGHDHWLAIRLAKFEDGVVSSFADVSARKDAEEEAKRDHLLLEMTGTITRTGGWEYFPSENRVTWSREVYRIHEVEDGFVPDLENSLSFYLPKSQQRVVDALERCEKDSISFDLELEIVTAKGRPLWVRAIGRRETLEGSNNYRLFGTFQDITENKNAEFELIDSSEQLQLALSSAAMGRRDWDVPEGNVRLDESSAHILGFEVAEMELTTAFWNGLIHSDDLPMVQKKIARHVSGEVKDFEAEYRMRAKSGGWIWVQDRGRGLDLKDGKPSRIVGTLLDITAKKTLEEERSRHLESLEQITQQVPGAVYQYLVNAEGEHAFVYLSRRIIDVYGRTPEELMADVDRGYDLIHPEDAIRVRESASHVQGVKAEWRQEFRIQRDGELRWILDQARPEVLPDGGILWNGFLMDVTDQKRLDQQLIQARDQAEEAGRAKSQFLAMMSHEIRTPMNAILGFADLLSQRPLPAQERDYVRTIGSSGEALLRIIDDILDHSRIESGRLRLESTIFSPEKLLDEVSILLAPSAGKKGLGLEVVTVGEIPRSVRGDMGRLRQILLNLAGNAVKFTPSGTVALGVEVAPGLPDPGLVKMRFFVRDEGPGIPATQVARIFEPFAQADSSVSRRYGGTGLGLAISRSLASLMGGHLAVQSNPGAGATFVLEVPFGIPREEAPAELGSPSNLDSGFAQTNPLKILAVDDDAVNLKLIEHVLEKLGYAPRVARGGEEAILLCEEEWPECVLLDVQMPDMDGLAVTRRLRELEVNGARPAVFITALTANVLPGERHTCLDAGMNGYLTKPLRRDQLARTLVEASQSVQNCRGGS